MKKNTKILSSLFFCIFKSIMSEIDEPTLTHDIDWSMLDKSRYIPLNILSTFLVRSALYPFTLVRTRLQVQRQSTIYRGTWHALRTTVRYEGFRSLYKGFVIYNFQLIPGLMFITSFESTRVYANILTKNEYVRAGIGGIIGSLCSQILACPIDIISQHMQLVGLTSPSRKMKSKDGVSSLSDTKLSTYRRQQQIERIHVPKEIRANNYLIFKHICRTLLYQTDPDQKKPSLKGFYRGYFISTFLFSFTSAVWWPSYYFFQRQMLNFEEKFRKIKNKNEESIELSLIFFSKSISIANTRDSMYSWSSIIVDIDYSNESIRCLSNTCSS